MSLTYVIACPPSLMAMAEGSDSKTLIDVLKQKYPELRAFPVRKPAVLRRVKNLFERKMYNEHDITWSELSRALGYDVTTDIELGDVITAENVTDILLEVDHV